MQVLHGIDGLRQLPPHTAMTIGNFDGLHRGHAHLMATCCQRRARFGSPVAVVTFEPHPATVLRPQSVTRRLTPAPHKQEIIQSMGADYYVVLPATPEVLNITAEDFWHILRDEARPAFLIEGPGFNFGKGRGGDVVKLTQWTAGSGVDFELVKPVTVALLDLHLVAVNSSLTRWLLAQGRVRDAAICLGRPYALRGEVVKGLGRGRTMGVHTANLLCGEQLIPADGVYAGRCKVAGRLYPAAVSIGDMPTFTEGLHQIEAHLLGFEGDLYGQQLEVDLLDWLREQSKFPSVSALKAQIDRDVIQTRRRTSMDPSAAIARSWTYS